MDTPNTFPLLLSSNAASMGSTDQDDPAVTRSDLTYLLALSQIVRRGRFNLLDEKRQTQRQIAGALLAAGIPFQREVRLSEGDIVDFVVGEGIAVEVKIKGAKKAIYRQLERYASHDCVHRIVLLSAQAISLPATIGGKPASCMSLSMGWL